MSKDKSYYDQFNNCDDIKNRYDYFTVLEAALIWCGIPNDQLEFEASQCQPKGDDNGLQRGTFIHPYVSCVEPRCLVLHQAFEDNFVKMGRDGGESGFKSLTDFAVGHIAHPRRTIKIADLKEYIKNYHNDDMPKSLFPELNVNQDRTLPLNLIHDVYGRTYDVNQHKKNREDDYLTLTETLSFLNYNNYDYVRLRDIARRKLITPCFYFDGYVGSFRGDSDNGFYTEVIAGYFTYRSLAEEICSDDDYMRLPNDGVVIYSVLEKKTAAYVDGDDVFLFNDKPRGLEDAEEFKLTHIDAGEIRFSKRALNSYIAPLANASQDDASAQNDSELLAKLEKLRAENDDLNTRLSTARNTYKQHRNEIKELTEKNEKAEFEKAELIKQLQSQETSQDDDVQLNGIAKYNADKSFVISTSQAFASYIWSMDTEKAIRTGEMVQQVRHVMHNVAPKLLPDDKAIREWLSGIAPDYAKKAGKTPKDAPSEISLIMKK